MHRIIDSHTTSIANLRVFSLSVALILITYSIAGIHLETPAKINLLGFAFVIDRPSLLAISLVLASVYSVARFLYFAMLVQPSPIRAKGRLKKGSRVDTSTTPGSIEELHKQISAEVHRYYPRIGSARVWFEISQEGEELRTKVTVPTVVRIIAMFEDVDFLAPIWLNILALGLWLWHILWQ